MISFYWCSCSALILAFFVFYNDSAVNKILFQPVFFYMSTFAIIIRLILPVFNKPSLYTMAWLTLSTAYIMAWLFFYYKTNFFLAVYIILSLTFLLLSRLIIYVYALVIFMVCQSHRFIRQACLILALTGNLTSRKKMN